MKKRFGIGTVAALVIGLAAFSADASTLLFDRGLPSINLNNAAGADRSNVTWAIVGGTGFTGDDFTIGSVGQKYVIDSITVWGAQVYPLGDDISNIWLYVGKSGEALSLLSTGSITGNSDSNANITHSYVTYADGTTDYYEGSSGTRYGLVETTFSGLNLLIDGGVTYNFGVDGDGYEWWNHASNAALSGTPQQGADGKYLVFDVADLASVNVVDSLGNGWDKSSDINVQVSGSEVPEPATLALTGVALLGLLAGRRRRMS